MRHLEVWGRRITVEPIDARAEARQNITGCLQEQMELGEHSSALQWEEEITNALKLLEQASQVVENDGYPGVRAIYASILGVSKSIQYPPGGLSGERGLTERLVRVSCLRYQHLLGEMGLYLAKRNSDSFSRDYYVKWLDVVRPKVRKHEFEL